MVGTNWFKGGKGPAFFASALSLFTTQGTHAQTAGSAAPISVGTAIPAPDQLELSKLIWSTMAAVDHANQAGNYSVLRDMSAPGFQALNDSAKLAQVFAGLRASNTDLSNTLLLAPTYRGPLQFVQRDVIRVQGAFLLRPTSVTFDLVYQWINGRWRLYGVSIAPLPIASEQPAVRSTPKTPERR
jgi:hypothetical protein